MTDPETGIWANRIYPPLPGSWKNRFPFTLACPSFIYPDHILPNVRMLAPFVDEIEVLVFESEPAQNLPPEEDIRQMAALAADQGITYNVHLPVDVNITHGDTRRQMEAIRRMLGAVNRVRPLLPSTWTLHLPFEEQGADAENVSQWQHRAAVAVERLLAKSGLDCRSLSIENLDYPPEWLARVAETMDLSVCLDMGHLVEHGVDIAKIYERFKNRISILHVYGGVLPGRGHTGLHRLARQHVPVVSRILSEFSGIVSLEVFSFTDLTASLTALEQLVS